MREESGTSATRIEEQINPHRVLVAMGICLFPLLLYALLLLSSVWATTGETVQCFLIVNFKGAVGIPLAIIAALTVVVLLATGISGDFQLEFFQLKLSGPSVPIFMWIACFLAIVLSLYLLFPNSQSPEPLPQALNDLCISSDLSIYRASG